MNSTASPTPCPPPTRRDSSPGTDIARVGDGFPSDEVTHILRLYLPPWRLEERLAETIRWCEEAGARHVMLFTDAQFMVWNQLADDEMETIVTAIRTAKTRLAAVGISIGINSSYNMRVSRADQRPHLDFDHWAAYADGTTDYRGPCLLDPKLERYLERFYRLLATVEPAYIYVDDDHRYMIQGQHDTWGCLCDRHVATFSARTGQNWRRAELRAALLNYPAVRGQWIEFLGERLVQLAAVIERAVHAVSPATKVGMMVPGVHCLPPVGHNLRNVLEALHPGAGKPLVRPCVGGYQDWRRCDLFAGLWYREFTGHMLGPEAEYTSEIETCPGTRLAKSMTVARFQIAHGLLQRMHVSAVSPASYVGDSPFLEPEFPRMLKESRPFFDALLRHAPPHGSGQGVQLYWDFDSARLAGGTLTAVTDLWWPAFAVAEVLGRLGIPATFAPAPIKAFFGDSIRGLAPDRLRDMLSGAVLLDAGAAKALTEMGFGDLTGCDAGGAVPLTAGAEKLTDAAFSGKYAEGFMPFVYNRLASVWTLLPARGTREISAIVNHDLQRIAPGVTLFENPLGGRVATLPYAIHAEEADISHLVCYHRRHQLKAVFDWMRPDAFPAWLEDPSDVGVHLWRDGERLTVCLSNLSFDAASEVAMEINDPALSMGKVQLINDDGALLSMAGRIVEETLSRQRRRWRVRLDLKPFRPAVLLMDL